MKLATLIEHRRRVRTSMEAMESALRARPDSWPSLAELAEAANLSPYHFIRVYQRAVGETPQVTVRRLKLQAARRHLLERRPAAVLDVALEHGYDSPQAFARAYAREFGAAPGLLKAGRPQEAAAVQAWLAHLPAIAMQTMALPDESDGVNHVFDEFMGHLDLGEIPRFAQDMFCVISPDLRFAAAGALQNRWVDRLLRLRQQEFGGSLHLCVRGQPDAAWASLRHSEAARRRHEDRPILLRYLNDPAYKARSEQLVELYVPIRGIGRGTSLTVSGAAG
jgi:AraC-like DNA-binding protein